MAFGSYELWGDEQNWSDCQNFQNCFCLHCVHLHYGSEQWNTKVELNRTCFINAYMNNTTTFHSFSSLHAFMSSSHFTPSSSPHSHPLPRAIRRRGSTKSTKRFHHTFIYSSPWRFHPIILPLSCVFRSYKLLMRWRDGRSLLTKMMPSHKD